MSNQDFLPEDLVESRRQRRAAALYLTLFVIVMAGVLGGFFVTDRQRNDVRELQARVDAEFEEAARRLEQLDQLEAKRDRIVRKAQLSWVLVERVPRSLILADLINNMPTTLSLLELELETKVLRNRRRVRSAMEKAKADADAADADKPKVKPTEITITLMGVAPTDVQVAAYLTALGRSEMFVEQNLLYSESTQVETFPMREFKIELKVNPELEPRRLSPRRVARDLLQDPMRRTIQINEHGDLIVPDDAAGEAPGLPMPGVVPVGEKSNGD